MHVFMNKEVLMRRENTHNPDLDSSSKYSSIARSFCVRRQATDIVGGIIAVAALGFQFQFVFPEIKKVHG